MAGIKRHREYSLIAVVLGIAAILLTKNVNNQVAILFVNVAAIAAIVLTSLSVVRHADVLANRFGEPFGSIILSLAITVLEVSLISVLLLTKAAEPTLLRDTLYSVVIIVTTGLVGISLLLGGRRYRSQYFNMSGVRQYLNIFIPLVLVTLFLPSTFLNGIYNRTELVVVSLLCVFMYAVFIVIQTRTHRSLFIYEDDVRSNMKELEDYEAEKHESPHSTAMHTIWMIAHIVFVILLTKLNSSNFSKTLDFMGAPEQVLGFVVAILILTPESTGAIKAVMNNHTQRGINLMFGAVVASVSLTVPIVVFIAILTGQDLVMGLPVQNLVVLGAAVILCQSTFGGGKTNALSGAAHLALFVAYLLTLFK